MKGPLMARAPFDQTTGIGEPVIGCFKEVDHGHDFEYSLNDEIVFSPPAHGGKNTRFPHKVWVGPLGEYRLANVMKTCVHIITDETELGWVIEKWYIKNHRRY
jgi:hypothetical protein